MKTNIENKMYLTITEASKVFEKHPDTIRALAKKNPKAVKKDESGKILIQYDLLTDTYDSAVENKPELRPNSEKIEKKEDVLDRTLEVLFSDLEAKNKQIADLQETIKQMTEQQNQLISQQQQISAFEMKLLENPKVKHHFWNHKH